MSAAHNTASLNQVILTICYATGLRISEAVCLKPSAIDSKRMVIRVEQGKDRYVMLPPKLLDILRDYWKRSSRTQDPQQRVGSQEKTDEDHDALATAAVIALGVGVAGSATTTFWTSLGFPKCVAETRTGIAEQIVARAL